MFFQPGAIAYYDTSFQDTAECRRTREGSCFLLWNTSQGIIDIEITTRGLHTCIRDFSESNVLSAPSKCLTKKLQQRVILTCC